MCFSDCTGLNCGLSKISWFRGTRAENWPKLLMSHWELLLDTHAAPEHTHHSNTVLLMSWSDPDRRTTHRGASVEYLLSRGTGRWSVTRLFGAERHSYGKIQHRTLQPFITHTHTRQYPTPKLISIKHSEIFTHCSLSTSDWFGIFKEKASKIWAVYTVWKLWQLKFWLRRHCRKVPDALGRNGRRCSSSHWATALSSASLSSRSSRRTSRTTEAELLLHHTN